MITGTRFLETFSGCGRLFDLYSKWRPSEVVMVDVNRHAIAHAKTHCKGVKAICSDVLSWSRQERRKFGVSVALWGLCYLDLRGVGEYLGWVKEHVQVQVFVEPVFPDHAKEEQEIWLDKAQQMIKRSAQTYRKFYASAGLDIRCVLNFRTDTLKGVDPSGCKCWVLTPQRNGRRSLEGIKPFSPVAEGRQLMISGTGKMVRYDAR